MAKAVQFFRAGSDNFCMASRRKVLVSIFNLLRSPELLLQPSPLSSHPFQGRQPEGLSISSACTHTRREWSPLRRLAHSLRDPGLGGRVGPGASGVKVGARAPHRRDERAQSVPPASLLAPSRHPEKVAVRDAAAAMTTLAIRARARWGCSPEEGGAEAGGGC